MKFFMLHSLVFQNKEATIDRYASFKWRLFTYRWPCLINIYYASINVCDKPLVLFIIRKFAVDALLLRLEEIRPKRSRPREPGRAARVTDSLDRAPRLINWPPQ